MDFSRILFTLIIHKRKQKRVSLKRNLMSKKRIILKNKWLLLLAISCLLANSLAGAFSQRFQHLNSDFPEDLRKSIVKGCHQEMSRKVLDPRTSKAYCFCYANELSYLFTEQDFDRMGNQGVNNRDQKFFKRARKSCKPDKEKKGKKQKFSFRH